MRTLIDLPEKLMKEIDSVAERDDISRAEAVRRAVADYVAKRSPSRPDAAFGIWKSRNVDALDYEDRLRNEWPK
jgi:metal-responsive CopG/Arc/MetJ family transcriptional regulator